MAREILDIRVLADEWRLLDTDECDQDETAKYTELCEELGVASTPDNLEDFGNGIEPTLIHEHAFTEYAQELAEDIGAIPSNLDWPTRHIDWQAAANELQQDYQEVTFDGEIYYVRSW